VILRASSRLGEHDAFERALPDLSDDEREHVVRARRRHRDEAVFLHELGHVLGALHEADVASLMNTAYDEKMSGYSEDALALMRLALEGPDRPSVAKAQLAYIRDAKSSPWTSADRDAAMGHLQSWMAPTQSAQAAKAGPPAESAPPELGEADGALFLRAVQSFRGGNTAFAYTTARPLFAAYPNSYAVQDLRCQLATVRWLEASAMVAECAPSLRLADAGTR
jgi:hypothetical protein